MLVLKREKVEQLMALKRRLEARDVELKVSRVGRSIALRAIDSNYDKHARIVVVTRETDADWWGWPLANPNCPVLQWPKLTWEEAR
jgi:hypothetical protein